MYLKPTTAKIPNKNLPALAKANTVSLKQNIRRWKWQRHVLRMDKNIHQRIALIWTLEATKKGRQRKPVEELWKEFGV